MKKAEVHSSPGSEEENAGEKKADLWEKTIVTTFRDLQWTHKPKNVVSPPSSVEFSGKIESAFGDAVSPVNGRFFLFEMKSTRGKIKRERQDGKLAYVSLLKKVRKTFDGEPGGDFGMLWNSMRFHHFLYWSEDASEFGPGLWPGALSFSSYLSEMSELGGEEVLARLQDVLSDSTLVVDLPDQRLKAVKSAFASRLFDDSVALITRRKQANGTPTVRYGLGASAMEIHSYVLWLLEEQREQDLPINALLASGDGVVCRHVSHVAELVAILEVLMDSSPKNTPVARVDLERPNPGWASLKPVSQVDYEAMPSNKGSRPRLGGRR
ncbi:hypothetical protein [Stenotrophomonas maltophilia]|uniref:hypothetical protein n=1 Tax=Stenotrophomonas maltophilia TaxID=40324 RepID=UPI002E77A2A2|nr:hypothetical protein [Stenotrophomonas maltophilia]